MPWVLTGPTVSKGFYCSGSSVLSPLQVGLSPRAPTGVACSSAFPRVLLPFLPTPAHPGTSLLRLSVMAEAQRPEASNTNNYCLTVLEARTPRLRRHQGKVSSGVSPLVPLMGVLSIPERMVVRLRHRHFQQTRFNP